MASNKARRRVTVIDILLATILLPIGAALAPVGIGFPIFAVGLALITPDA